MNQSNKTILSGAVIIEDGKILLLWKNKQQHYELPGGKVDPGELLEEAAIREAREEIGCDIEIIKYLGFSEHKMDKYPTDDGIKISHKFLVNIKEGQRPKVAEPDKFSHMLWMPLAEWKSYVLAPNVSELVINFIKEYPQG